MTRNADLPNVSGRVHLVTGGGRGIGRAIATHLVANGDAVAVLDLGCRVDGAGADPEVAEAIADELGESCIAFATDVRDETAVEAAIATIIDRWGRLDGVLNVAGILRTGNIVTTADDDWATILDTNLRGTMVVSRAAIRQWIASGSPGRIVNVTSTAGLEGIPEMFAYATSKAGVIGLTLATANAVACRGILVNAIAPLAATRMAVRGMGERALAIRAQTGDWPDIVASTGQTPELVAPVAGYLVSAGLRVTGQIFAVGGGTCSRLSAPSPGPPVNLDVALPTAELAALLDQTVGSQSPPSRWQAATFCSEAPDFPVADLDGWAQGS